MHLILGYSVRMSRNSDESIVFRKDLYMERLKEYLFFSYSKACLMMMYPDHWLRIDGMVTHKMSEVNT